MSALALAGGSAVADSGSQDRAADAVIKMKFSEEQGPFFKGDKSVPAGGKLRVVNASDPRKIGPHTISLVDKTGLITSGAEAKECGKLAEGACKDIFDAHEVNPKTFKVKKALVDNGDDGWDTEFVDGADGDSWYTETKGEKLDQVVSGEVDRQAVLHLHRPPGHAGQDQRRVAVSSYGSVRKRPATRRAFCIPAKGFVRPAEGYSGFCHVIRVADIGGEGGTPRFRSP